MSFQQLILRLVLRVKRFAVNHQPISAIEPLSRLDVDWWRVRWGLKAEELAREQPELIFFGDSITHNWELTGPPSALDLQSSWRRFFGKWNATNLGYSGDATDNLLWRLRNGELDGQRPRLVVVLIGMNDILVHARPVDVVLAGIRAVCIEIRERVPDARVLLLALLPSEFDDFTSRRSAEINASLLAPGWAPPDVTTFDIGHALLKDGRPDRHLYCDTLINPALPVFLHPNAEGQNRLAAALATKIASMMRVP